MSSIVDRLAPEMCVSLASLAAEHDMTIEDVIVDVLNGSYCSEDHQFYVCFPDNI